MHDSVIFDFDGTLVDSSLGILETFAAVLASRGCEPQLPLQASIIGPPLAVTLSQLTGLATDADLAPLIDDFKRIYDSRGYRATRPFVGTATLLSDLRDIGVRLAIATNKRLVPTLRILDHFGWRAYFEQITSLDASSPPHCDKRGLLADMLKSGSPGRSPCYVGDTQADADAAAANGLPFFYAAWGYGGPESNPSTGATVLAHPADLLLHTAAELQ